MATTYANTLIDYGFIYQTLFSAKIDKQDEDGQMLDELELYKNLNNSQNLVKSVMDNSYYDFSIRTTI